MAEKVIIPLEAKVDKAIEEIAGLKEELKGVAEANKTAAKATKGLASGFKGLGLAMKTAGIGLIIGALNMLKEVLMKNQPVVDFMDKAMTSLGLVFQKVSETVIDLGTNIIDAFSNPKEALEGLWEAIKTNIVNRFEGLINQFKAVGKVLEGVFTLDWDMIKEGASDSATAFVQIATGLDEVQQTQAQEFFKETATAIAQVTTEAVKTADALVDQRKEVELLEAGQQKLMLTYQNQAELQRQIRDDESLTFEERIAANERLGEILDEQLETEQSLAQRKLDLAKAELELNSENLELQKAVILAETELVDIEERITGQRSEQLTNTNALVREQIDATNELALVGKSQRELEITELNQWYKDKLKLAKKAGVDTENIDKEFARRKKKITQAQINDEVAAFGQLAGALGALAGDNKELAAAEAIIHTYLGATKAFGQGGVVGFVTAAAVIAAGLANVKKIYDTDIPSGEAAGGSIPSGISSGGGNVPSVGSSIAAAIPTETNLTDVVSSVNNRNQEPIRAYVVAQEVTDSQEANAYLNNQKTL